MKALQNMADAKTREEAEGVFEFMSQQDGFLGGRLLPPSSKGEAWRVQTFHHDDGEPEGLLPDGIRRVEIPDFLRARLGITIDIPADLQARIARGAPMTLPHHSPTIPAREFISEKIRTLMHEGRPQKQAIRIAFEMARRAGYRSVGPAPRRKRRK